jgi:hypothetical protein
MTKINLLQRKKRENKTFTEDRNSLVDFILSATWMYISINQDGVTTKSQNMGENTEQ